MADNHSTIVNGGNTPDWIELYNSDSGPVDIGGMSISDDPAVPRKFVFPRGTIIEGRSTIIIWCDNDAAAPGLHTGFALAATGQRVTLYSADTVPKQVDVVEFGLQLEDYTIGRVPDGTGTWQLCKPTPWQPNKSQPLGSRAKLRINEWMPSPSAGDDWFELYNADSLPVALGGLSLTDDPAQPAKSVIPALSFVLPYGFQLFWADQKPYLGANHVNFKLSAGGETIALYSGSTLLDRVDYGQQQTDVSMGRLPDGASRIVSFTRTASPGASNYLPLTNVAINEVLAHTDFPFEDAVELVNLTPNAIDISGWYLSNSASQPMKYRIPNGTVLPANGYLVIYEYQFN
ncbi:MAG: lamin tail domain-containing protein, partial [Verrucomicrobiae bacterium]|nr:lamin tail domain-containing protein [Verrucomicrobiae bacterium]